jgi:hypothetical protein
MSKPDAVSSTPREWLEEVTADFTRMYADQKKPRLAGTIWYVPLTGSSTAGGSNHDR